MVAISSPPALRAVVDAIRRAGGRPLIVGGAVRDAALGLEPKDFDVEAYGIDVDALIASLEPVGSVNQVGKSFGVLKVTTPDLEIDVALPRRESKAGRGHKGFMVAPDPRMTPEEAALRRDFTINAMAYDPATGELLDFHGGLGDLERRVLRHTGPRFADDPLRVLRGVQLCGRFDLTADPDTVELSRSLLGEHDTLARERIFAEWAKWAAKSVRPSAGLRFLEQCGWRAAYPELEALDGCPQEPEWHPEGDVWTHTSLAVDAAARIAIRNALAAEDRTVLVFAALVHDLGKPRTTERAADGRIRSPGHAAHLEPIESLLERLGCPARVAVRVVGLTLHHLTHLGSSGSPRHVRRLARALGEHAETIEMLARLVEADADARPPLPGGLPPEMARILELARGLAAAAASPRPLLQGRHLLELGLQAGPGFGEILRAAFEAQLDGAFDTLEGAKAWLARHGHGGRQGPV